MKRRNFETIVAENDSEPREKKADITQSNNLDWRECLEKIAQMRLEGDAPVDTKGCHMLADKTADPQVLFTLSLVRSF